MHEVRWMFHSTAMVVDYDRTVDAMRQMFGLEVLEYSDQLTPEVGRRGGMTWVGDNSVEIGQPIVPGAGADKFVRRTGGAVHSIAVQVRDIEASIAHLESLGVRIAARPAPDFFFTDPKHTDGIFIEWGAIEMAEDPRFGAPIPAIAVPPLLEVTHHAFVGAVVDDPVAAARRLASLFATEVTFEQPTAPAGDPVAGVSVGDCTLALWRHDAASSRELWGQDLERARTHVLGLRVPDLAAASRRLSDAGVAIVRSDASMTVLEPEATGGAAVVLVEQLLPGDPRTT